MMLDFLKKGNGVQGSDIKLISHSKVKVASKTSESTRSVSVKRAQCTCCGTLLHFPSNVPKFKCAICQITVTLAEEEPNKVNDCTGKSSKLSLNGLNEKIGECLNNGKEWSTMSKEQRCTTLEPVTTYLSLGFRDKQTLQNSFRSSEKHESVDYVQLNSFYNAVLELPSRRPFFRMLCSCNDLLKKPGELIEDFHWILVIFSNPMVRQCLVFKDSKVSESPHIRSVSYELTKRCIGYLSNIPEGKSLDRLVHYFKYSKIDIFRNHVETLNLYITFQLLRILHKHDGQATNSTRNNEIFDVSEHYNNADSGNILEETKKNMWNSKSGTIINSKNFKFKLFEYENDWHIRTATRLMMLLHKTNNRRKTLLNIEFSNSGEFYNMMLDFIDYKTDFDKWKGLTSDRLKAFTELNLFNGKRFTLCNYPFLLSLGIKISIMEYEIRRIMEYEAEQAFLSSLDKGKTVAVYLKIKVRREHIASDSLRCIKSHQSDLMKSLRVEFINEPGIDAGGLRKEWFFLLTKSLFNPMNGLFTYSEESFFSWPSIKPIVFEDEGGSQQNEELYYLFGIVLGLAIFNSTILDLQFPRAFYKKLTGETISFNDYLELYPKTGANLLKMLEYDGEDFFDTFGVYFEITIQDNNLEIEKGNGKEQVGIGGKKKGKNFVNFELCSGGGDIKVTQQNKKEFVNKWVDFHMNQSIKRQFSQFNIGFHQVFQNCVAIELFNSEELEKLVCGNQENNCYDFQMLRSVTKYLGGFTDKSKVINWFWDIIDGWDLTMQKKLLRFISGADRVPPTGMSTLPFRISRLGNGSDSNKLPLAHTCFNELCIWEYSSKNKLENKLWWAVTQSEGYAFK